MGEMCGPLATSRRVLFGSVMFISVAAIVCYSTWVHSPTTDKRQARQRRQTERTPFTFNDVFSGEFTPRFYSLTWLAGENKYRFVTAEGDLATFNVDTNTTEILMDADTFSQLNKGPYYVSHDQRFIMFGNERQQVWRYSYLAWYNIYDRLEPDPDRRLIQFPQDDNWRGKKLQYAAWAPSSHALVFVANNNLYYQNDPFSPAQQITTDGAFENIFNGIPDWVYEEEIIYSRGAVYWAPDSQRFVFARFDSSQVPRFKFPRYGPETDVFGYTEEIAYPKAGHLVPGTNTNVSLYMVNVADVTGTPVPVPVASEFAGQDHYFRRVSWASASHVMVEWANRVQNHTVHSLCDTSGSCVKNLERQQAGGWIRAPTIYWIDNGAAYLMVYPRLEGSSGQWPQVTHITAPTDALGQLTFLTQGAVEVVSINGVDQERQLVFFLSTNGDPKRRHLFRVGLPSAEPSLRDPVCVTCDVDPGCQFVSAYFSTTGRYFRRGCQGPGVPTYTLSGTNLYREEVLEGNSELEARLNGKLLPVREYRQIPVGGGQTAEAQIWLPPNFDSSKEYPMLINTYAGPGSQRVSERFVIDWHTYLSSSENVIIGGVDGRGSRGRGDDFQFLMYRRFGDIEVEDQLFGGQYFRDEAYVNASKMAIWGWSYGGYTTLHALANETNVFGSGISVAPFIDPRLYDTGYTERYMARATVDDNQAGYQVGNVTRKIEHFRGKNLLMAHGTADDNVHFQNVAKLIKSLTEAEIQYRLQVYPDLNHSIRGGNSRRHLYRSFTNFLLKKCWGMTPQGL